MRRRGLAGLPNAVHAHMERLAGAFRTARPAVTPGDDRGAGLTLAVQTFSLAILAPASALVVSTVVDGIFGGEAGAGLAVLCGLGGLAAVHELIVRRARSALAADAGIRVAAGLTRAWFMGLLADESAAAPVSAQLAHFRALRRLRRVLSGPLTTALLDLPVAAAIGVGMLICLGPLGAPAFLAVALHAIAGRVLYPMAHRTALRGARAREALRVALAESAAKRATLDELGMTGPWATRIEALALEVAEQRRREQTTDAAVDAVGGAISGIAAAATIWIGASLASSGACSVGAVVAAMMLTVRCVAPTETVFRSLVDVRFAAAAVRRQGVRRPQSPASDQAPARADARISLRGVVTAAQEGAAALRGVSLDIAPGEIVAVCGSAGAGKSALLRVLLGQTRVVSGTVLLDGCDLATVNPSAWRAAAGHAPQRPTLFHGTVAQNIRLLAPAASDGAIAEALGRAGVRLPHPQLPQGAETRLMSGGGGQIEESLRAKIVLAGLYAKAPRLLLLDDPGAFLDRDGDDALMNALVAMRGRTTVVIVTDRPSHLRICDRIVRLEHGMIVSDGPAALVLRHAAA